MCSCMEPQISNFLGNLRLSRVCKGEYKGGRERFCTCSTIFFLDEILYLFNDLLSRSACSGTIAVPMRGAFAWKGQHRALFVFFLLMQGNFQKGFARLLLDCPRLYCTSFHEIFLIGLFSCLLRIKCLLQSKWVVLGFICASFHEMFLIGLFSYLIFFI